MVRQTRRLVLCLIVSMFLLTAVSFLAGYFYSFYDYQKDTIITSISTEAELAAMGLRIGTEEELAREDKEKEKK